ncbi:helix-turn-helix domain-containing protein [Clostridium sp. MCC353]|uniref:AraC family transcriptional regulator n=1 Tax=Clostridium sp. MCC353 TaxID=2592646 RepID=UPI001C02CF40|nr:helix-turn-helix domain-containing protein [Clostridium sp. MCC353]MBT9777469.1 helix-turn-helix domain-containing protein [Clostridium sp. MCC353]
MRICLKKNGAKKEKYYMILLSYLVILVIPLIFGAFLHIYNKKLVTQQSETMTKQMLVSISDQVDSYMGNIWQMALGTTQMESIQRVLNAQNEDEASVSYELYQLSQNLQRSYGFEQRIEDIFVYFNDSNRIAGRQGVMDFDFYCDVYFGKGMPVGELQEQLGAFHYKECLSLPVLNGAGNTLCLISEPGAARIGDPNYTVVVVFKNEALKTLVESIRWMDQATVLIEDRGGQILCGTDNIQYEDYLQGIVDMEDTRDNYIETEFKNDKYAAMVKQSADSGWKYYMLMPKKLIEANADQMQRYYFITLFGCIIIGFIVAGILTKKHYHPVKILWDLIAQFKTHNETRAPQKNEDNYQWLQEQMEQFFKERVNAMKILKQNRRELKQYYLLQLLENTYTAGLNDNLKKNQIFFEYPYYAVVQFIFINNKNAEEQVLVQFILENIFTELIEEAEGFQIYMVHVGERKVGIVNFSEMGRLEQIRELVHCTLDLIEDKFGYVVTALLGGTYSRKNEIFKSYADTCEIEGYISLLEDNLICYEDVCGWDQKYRYNAQLDQKLFNAVEAGNQEIAQNQLKRMLEQNLSGEISLTVYQCLMFDLLGTILKAADAGGYHSALEDSNVMEKISAKLPLNQLEPLFLSLIENICGKIRELQSDTGKDKELSRKIQEFILENFKNPDLNVSQTGLHFNMTPSYLSAIYKKQTGSSLLEYINNVRLLEAERLLEQGMSVVEVAKRAGFRDSTYLIRIYKKKKGITPGQKKQK